MQANEIAQTVDVNGQPWLLDARVADRSVILAGAMTAGGEPVNWQSVRVHEDKRKTASADKRDEIGSVHVLNPDELGQAWKRLTVVMFRWERV